MSDETLYEWWMKRRGAGRPASDGGTHAGGRKLPREVCFNCSLNRCQFMICGLEGRGLRSRPRGAPDNTREEVSETECV